ncbi:MAG: amidohydrolase [Deltaproteobacteria bacterium]|nr:amidohydrolase [Candidatus Zymogenaceae bacterium]
MSDIAKRKRVIDCAVTPPFKEFGIVPSYMKDYYRVYGSELEEGLKTLVSAEWTPESFVAYLDSEGIDIAVIRSRDIETTFGMKIPDEACANLINRFPDRFVGLAGADPFKGKAALKNLEHAITDLGLKGIDLWTYEYNLPASDRTYWPLYEKCLELNAIVFIESSMHFRRDARMDICRPIHIDYVAVDFPELKIVGSTPGFPWVAELMAVAWRHPNVYVSTSSVRPKYLGKPNSGYETLMQLGGSVLADKIMFASGWPMLSMKQGVNEVLHLPLREEVKEKWLYRNAARLFGLDGE